LHLGAPPETYDRAEGPVQQAILRAVSLLSGVAPEDVILGTDGCGVPVFGMPVRAMALMYARLAAPPAEFDETTRRACRRLAAAMTAHPDMVGGTTERFATEGMRAARGRGVPKVGAEGVDTADELACEGWQRG